MKIPLLARRAFAFHGRSLVAGEVFLASPIEALALRYQGHARFVPSGYVDGAGWPPLVKPLPDPPTMPPSEPEKKRRYRRRDMQAEK